jgi:hypothetical protein
VKHTKEAFIASATCLISVILVFRFAVPIEAAEFGGGGVTRHLVDLEEIGVLLFVVAIVLSFLYARLASIAAITACFLCLPFYIYFIIPGLFRRILPGEYSIPLQTYFVWNTWAVIGLFSMVLTFAVHIRNSLVQRKRAAA